VPKLKGHHSWLILAGVILLLDLTAPTDETLSDATRRAMTKNPFLTLAAVAVTSAHLTMGRQRHFRLVDPYRVIGLVRRARLTTQ